MHRYLGWRWTNWIVMIISGLALLFMVLLKETYAPALLRKKAKLRRKEQDDDRYWSRYDSKIKFWPLLKVNLSRPFVMIFTEPIWSAFPQYLTFQALILTARQCILGYLHSNHLRHPLSLLRCLSYRFYWCSRLVVGSFRTCVHRPSRGMFSSHRLRAAASKMDQFTPERP